MKNIYILLLLSLSWGQSWEIGFIATDIATNVDGAASVFAADMDGDGDMDIVSASKYDDTINKLHYIYLRRICT